MTDEELLELVQMTSPQDLSPEQERLIQQRLSESAELQRIFRSRLKLQSYLVEMSSRSKQDAAETPSNASPQRTFKWLAPASLGFVFAVLLIVGGVFGLRDSDSKPAKVSEHRNSSSMTELRDEQQPTASAESVPTDTDTDTRPSAASEAVEPPGKESSDQGFSDSSLFTDGGPQRPAAAILPWQTALADDVVPQHFEAVCFDQFDTTLALPQRADLEHWFGPVSGAEAEITEARGDRGTCGAIHGLHQLKAPWTKDSVLRVGLADYAGLKIHFFRGPKGVSMVNHGGGPGGRWVAYLTSRRSDASTPDTWAITATDGSRTARTGLTAGGSLEFRHRNGELILSRGDVILLRAPLDRLPRQVFFQGSTSVYGISFLRTYGMPVERSAFLTVQQFDRPLEQLKWTRHVSANTRVESIDDGNLRFENDSDGVSAWIQTDRTDGQAMVLQLEDATPGVRIHLTDREGSSLAVWGYVRDQDTGQLLLALQGSNSEGEARFHKPDLTLCRWTSLAAIPLWYFIDPLVVEC